MLIFYSDPHLGFNRTANTTVESRKRWSQYAFDTLHQKLKDLKAEHPAAIVICAGDMFDKESNDEATLLQAMKLMEATDVVLAGNHDLPNREGKESTLRVLQKIYGDERIVLPTQTSDWGWDRRDRFTLLPHHGNQDLFDKAIAGLASESNDGVLVTHCNYDSERAAHNDASLNLTRAQAKGLLASGFKFIVNGHEHAPRNELQGRFRIVGNAFPTGFGDISDKYVWLYDEKQGQWTAESLFSKGEAFKEVWLPAGFEIPVHGEPLFIDLVGKVEPEQGPAVAEYITHLFDQGCFAVRNRVTYTTSDQVVGDLSEVGASVVNLANTISADLKDSDLGELFNKYKQEVSK